MTCAEVLVPKFTRAEVRLPAFGLLVEEENCSKISNNLLVRHSSSGSGNLLQGWTDKTLMESNKIKIRIKLKYQFSMG